jgi:hypothetical protein
MTRRQVYGLVSDGAACLGLVMIAAGLWQVSSVLAEVVVGAVLVVAGLVGAWRWKE